MPEQQYPQVKDFIEEVEMIEVKKLFFISNPRKLCSLPYPSHPKGCPNIVNNTNPLTIHKNYKCPPFAQRLKDKYDLSYPSYLIYIKFNLKKQKERMKSIHPEWTDKQCKCLLYWQNSVKKILEKEARHFAYGFTYSKYCRDYELIPEAMGLNVFESMKYHGIILERNPENYVYKIAFVGILKGDI